MSAPAIEFRRSIRARAQTWHTSYASSGTMSRTTSMRFPDNQVITLRRTARALGKTVSETCALLIEEKLRETGFGFIEFRASPIGRQAYMKGSRLPVWCVVHTTVDVLGGDVAAASEHFGRPLQRLRRPRIAWAPRPPI